MPETAPRRQPTHSEAPARESWSVDAVPDSVPGIRERVVAFARAHGADAATCEAIALAATEAATNGVVHAFVEREPGTIRVESETAADAIVVSVADDGCGMRPRHDSPGLRMGIPLIGQLTAELDIRERPGGGTVVRMTFAAPGVRGPARETDPRYAELLADVSALAQRAGWPTQGVEALADLLVPTLADAVAVDVIDEDGVPRRIAGRVEGADALSEWLSAREAPVDRPGSPSWQALRSGQAHVVAITDELLAETSLDDEDLERSRELGARWWVTLPLAEGERVLGLLHVALRDAAEPSPERLDLFRAVAERAARGLANRRLVEELRRTRRRLDRILGSLAEAVTVHDEKGQTIYANEAAARLLGLGSVEEVLAHGPGQLAARFAMTREDGSPVAVEDLPGRRLVAGLDAPPLLTRSVERATGRERWLLTKATRIDDEEPLAVNVIEDVTQAKRAERRLRLLAGIGPNLRHCTNVDECLASAAELMVPELGDWCVIDRLEESGALRRLAVAHADPDKLRFAREIAERYPPDDEDYAGMRAVIDSGSGELWPVVTDEMLVASARDDEHLRLLRKVGMRSVVIVPLAGRRTTLGTMTLITADSARAFTAEDVEYAEDVARRVAVAAQHAEALGPE